MFYLFLILYRLYPPLIAVLTVLAAIEKYPEFRAMYEYVYYICLNMGMIMDFFGTKAPSIPANGIDGAFSVSITFQYHICPFYFLFASRSFSFLTRYWLNRKEGFSTR